MSGLLTNSGRLVSRESGHPSLMDIAIGISRQPRFGGQTGRWWSVLDHSLFCDALVQATIERRGCPPIPGAGDDEESLRRCRIALLLHDAHEGLTGDVPSPLKTTDFKAMQEDLDRRIYGAFLPGGYGSAYWLSGAGWIGSIDLRALRVEAGLFLPHPAEKIAALFGEPEADDIVTLNEYLQESYAGRPPLRNDQDVHPGVQEYLRRLLELM